MTCLFCEWLAKVCGLQPIPNSERKKAAAKRLRLAVDEYNNALQASIRLGLKSYCIAGAGYYSDDVSGKQITLKEMYTVNQHVQY